MANSLLEGKDWRPAPQPTASIHDDALTEQGLCAVVVNF
jgi:hypothetical protein